MDKNLKHMYWYREKGSYDYNPTTDTYSLNEDASPMAKLSYQIYLDFVCNASKSKQELNTVREFAKVHGYDDIRLVLSKSGVMFYQPVSNKSHDDIVPPTGLPCYIKVDGDDISMVVDSNFELFNYFKNLDERVLEFAKAYAEYDGVSFIGVMDGKNYFTPWYTTAINWGLPHYVKADGDNIEMVHDCDLLITGYFRQNSTRGK